MNILFFLYKYKRDMLNIFDYWVKESMWVCECMGLGVEGGK